MHDGIPLLTPYNATAQTAARSAGPSKHDARRGLERPIHVLLPRLQASPDTEDGDRTAMGIGASDKEGSLAGRTPTTRPVVTVDPSQRLQRTIHFTDKSSPTRKAKPAGVMGAEISAKLVPVAEPPPAAPDELTCLTINTRTAYTTHFDGADAGKTAHYMLRWPALDAASALPWCQGGSTNGEKGQERDGQRDGGSVGERIAAACDSGLAKHARSERRAQWHSAAVFAAL